MPMTKAYAAKRLLELGGLPFAEFWAITGWPKEEARAVLDDLLRRGEIVEEYFNCTFIGYAVAEVA